MNKDDEKHLETEGGKTNKNKNLLLLEGRTTKSSLAYIPTFREVSLMTALLCYQSGIHLLVCGFSQTHQDKHSRRMKVKQQTS